MKQIIRSIRKGTVQWSEEDRLAICNHLIKAGYTVRIGRRPVPGQDPDKKNVQMEYIVEYWEEE